MSENTMRRGVLAGAVGLVGMAAGAGEASAAGSGSGQRSDGPSVQRQGRDLQGAGSGDATGPVGGAPLEFAYFRTWHDRAADPSRPNSMFEIPAAVDLAFVFPDYTPEGSPFWSALKDEYVPHLRAQGTRVVRTVDIGAVLDPAFPDTPQGRRDNAENLVESAVEAQGLDGLDIDMERALGAADTERAIGVFDELSAHLGPRSGSDRLFVYDTNRDGDVELFRRTAGALDFVLVQSYGRSVNSLQATWDTFAPYIDPAQYLIGFSFYEENDTVNRWDDTSEPFEASRAAAFADWQPQGARKGGIFSYAVDRDGMALGDDRILHTDYTWTTKLRQRMEGNA